jgi:hypothetical protein
MATIKKKILRVRRGTTEFNESDRLRGRIDHSLNLTGLAALSRLLLLENPLRRWTVVGFRNSTSRPDEGS